MKIMCNKCVSVSIILVVLMLLCAFGVSAEEKENNAKSFFYEEMTDSQKQVYDELMNLCLSSDKDFDNVTDDNEYYGDNGFQTTEDYQTVYEVLSQFKKDNPQFFWLCEKPYTYTNNETSEKLIKLLCKPEYRLYSVRKNIQQEIDDALSELKTTLKSDMYKSDVLKVKYISQWAYKNISVDDSYSTDEKKSYLCTALCNKATDVKGFETAVMYILHEVGFKSICVSGYNQDYYDSSWNIVSINGKWYNLVSDTGDEKTFCTGSDNEKQYFSLEQELTYVDDDLPTINKQDIILPEPSSVNFVTDLPINNEKQIGDSIVLTVETNECNGMLTYQWFKDGISLGNKYTSKNLEISNISKADEGKYKVEITNALPDKSISNFSNECEIKVAEKSNPVIDKTDSQPTTDPTTVDPTVTNPPTTNPPTTDPPAIDPPAIDPTVTDPTATDPPAIDPTTTDSPTVEPPKDKPSLVDSTTVNTDNNIVMSERRYKPDMYEITNNQNVVNISVKKYTMSRQNSNPKTGESNCIWVDILFAIVALFVIHKIRTPLLIE